MTLIERLLQHFLFVAGLGGLLAGPGVECASALQAVHRVSVATSGAQAGGGSFDPRVSASGRYVVFESWAHDLVPFDTNGVQDVFLHDRVSGVTEIVSVDDLGSVQGPFGAHDPVLAGDGGRMLFWSANSYEPSDQGGVDVFVRERQLSTTRRISIAPSGQSADGDSSFPEISVDGQWAAFLTEATNLVSGVDANGGGINGRDVILRDLGSGSNERLNVSSAGVQSDQGCHGVGISADGRFVGFWTASSNLVPGDTNGRNDVFVRDRVLATTERVSVDSNGIQGNGHSSIARVPITADGRFVAFNSSATDLVPSDLNGFPDIFVRDRLLGTTERANLSVLSMEANDVSSLAAISSDGRFVVFDSTATNLAPGYGVGRGIYQRDRVAGTTRRFDLAVTGDQPNASCFAPGVSGDGTFVVFHTHASNLVVGDTNQVSDVFVVDGSMQSPAVYCTASTDSHGCVPSIGWSGVPSAGGTAPFHVGVSGTTPRRFSALFYSTAGSAAVPFTGGTLCLTSPLKRTTHAMTSAGAPCTGALGTDFRARIVSGVDPALTVGARVWTQYWIRDPQAVATVVLSDAAWFVIEL